jgi:hypothetical protein
MLASVINTYVSLMYELKKKLERYLRVNLLGPGPRLMQKELEKYLRVNLLGPGPRLMQKEFTRPRSHKS